MAWVTTKTGKHINTDWFDDDERKKQSQIEGAQIEAQVASAAESRKRMSLDTLKYEIKKWEKRQGYAKRNRELDNLKSGIEFIDENFGDVSDLVGQVLIRNGSWSGLYDRDGLEGRGRATYFNGSMYIGEGLVVHELTHAISEEIADHFKELGFSHKEEVFAAIRSEVYANLGKTEPTYDNRKWADRSAEFISRRIESYGHAREDKRDALFNGNADYVDGPIPLENAETLSVLKKWWKKIGRA